VRQSSPRYGRDDAEGVHVTESRVQAPNGERYPLVGGTRQRRFDGTSFEPKKPLENAASPTNRVHAVLGCVFVCQYFLPFQQRLEGPEVVLH